jgi:hypothetical protein
MAMKVSVAVAQFTPAASSLSKASPNARRLKELLGSAAGPHRVGGTMAILRCRWEKKTMESKDHAWEILYRVTRDLAIGSGPLAERLRHAHADGLHQLQPERFPWPDLQEPLRDILDCFGSDGHGGSILDQIEDADRTRVAGEIFDLYQTVNDWVKNFGN